MAASTIVRDTWTNDTGSAAVPAADGTVLNNAALQNNIYARIDAMFAGAGAYATFTLGGKLAVEGFGAHTYTAGGVGGNTITVRNTTAGTGNYAAVLLGNDSAALAFGLFGYSSTYTTSGPSIADSLQVYSGQAGGLSIAAQHASGVIRFYTGGTTERMRIDAAGAVEFFGEAQFDDLLEFTEPGGGVYGYIDYLNNAGQIVLNSYPNGAGAKTGNYVAIGRNTSGSGAAGYLQLTDANATAYAIWVDTGGKLRISSGGPPQEDGTPSDTSGTVVGTQT